MTTTITYPGATAPIVPILVDGYASNRQSGVTVHPIAGRSSPDVTLAPAALRTGVLRLLFSEEADAKAAEDAHALPVAFTLSSDDRTTIDMYYVVTDSIARTLDGQTRAVWIIEVPFQEVTP